MHRVVVKSIQSMHDRDNSHSILVDNLGLSEELHTTKETKSLKDKENPMDPIKGNMRG